MVEAADKVERVVREALKIACPDIGADPRQHPSVQ